MSLHGGEHPFFEPSWPCPAAIDAGKLFGVQTSKAMADCLSAAEQPGKRETVLDCSGQYQRKGGYHTVQFLCRRDTYYREATCPVPVCCNAAANIPRRTPAKNSIRGACVGTQPGEPMTCANKAHPNRRRFWGELNE